MSLENSQKNNDVYERTRAFSHALAQQATGAPFFGCSLTKTGYNYILMSSFLSTLQSYDVLELLAPS